MKHLFLLISIISINVTYAQDNYRAGAKETIEIFFKGFHEQDSAVMNSVTRVDMTLRSIMPKKSGNIILTEATNRDSFVASILSISKDNEFEERILDFKVLVDGAMALVWTPYEFYFNGVMSHCGVNNFTLFKNGDHWEIVSIVDTRRNDCEI